MNSSHHESLQRLGFNAFFRGQLSSLLADQEGSSLAWPARVLWVARGQYLVSLGETTRLAVLAGRLKNEEVRVCVGDFVLLEANATDSLARIVHVFQRSSLFQRKAVGEGPSAQFIAANVDLAIVVCAFSADDADLHVERHGLNPRRIERYLWAIREAPARALVVLNKADLSTSAAEQSERLQRELCGVRVLPVSAEQGVGLEQLDSELLPGTTAILVGSSGVGKSSLTNRLLGEPTQAVSAVREDDTRGRHTTTSRELFVLKNGALLIDTPGMREFGLFSEQESESVVTGFAEIDALAPGCRFRDCRHQSEPGCAVLLAVSAGDVAGERLEQAHKFGRELAWQQGRLDPRKMSEQRSVWRARTRSARAEQKRRKER